MTSLIQFFCGLRFDPRTNYTILQKKDDDLGRVQAQKWVRLHPVHEEMKHWEHGEAMSYAAELIQSLKTLPITPSNKDLIQPVLIDVCKINGSMKTYLIKHFDQLNGNNDQIADLKEKIILTWPR